MRNFIFMILLVIANTNALADSMPISDWTLIVQNAYTETFVVNASGSTFGLLCFDDSCEFYLDTGLKCEEKAQYPMLINANSGSIYAIGICNHFPSKDGIRYLMSLNDKGIVSSISAGKEIGFALPVEGGQFKVARFSLGGAVEATNSAVLKFNKLKSKPSSQKLKDVML